MKNENIRQMNYSGQIIKERGTYTVVLKGAACLIHNRKSVQMKTPRDFIKAG